MSELVKKDYDCGKSVDMVSAMSSTTVTDQSSPSLAVGIGITTIEAEIQKINQDIKETPRKVLESGGSTKNADVGACIASLMAERAEKINELEEHNKWLEKILRKERKDPPALAVQVRLRDISGDEIDISPITIKVPLIFDSKKDQAKHGATPANMTLQKIKDKMHEVAVLEKVGQEFAYNILSEEVTYRTQKSNKYNYGDYKPINPKDKEVTSEQRVFRCSLRYEYFSTYSPLRFEESNFKFALEKKSSTTAIQSNMQEDKKKTAVDIEKLLDAKSADLPLVILKRGVGHYNDKEEIIFSSFPSALKMIQKAKQIRNGKTYYRELNQDSKKDLDLCVISERCYRKVLGNEAVDKLSATFSGKVLLGFFAWSNVFLRPSYFSTEVADSEQSDDIDMTVAETCVSADLKESDYKDFLDQPLLDYILDAKHGAIWGADGTVEIELGVGVKGSNESDRIKDDLYLDRPDYEDDDYSGLHDYDNDYRGYYNSDYSDNDYF